MMLYTEMTKKALMLSFNAHKNHCDKNGIPYVYHPFHLAEQLDSENETIVALLHDVVEDTSYTLDDIKSMGFPDAVIEALALLTRDKSLSYMDYINKIKSNPLASTVKAVDLRHNSDLSRLDTIDVQAIKRVQKYAAALKLLTGEVEAIENISFCCYRDKYVSLYGDITNGCLNLTSCVYEDEYDSEKNYHFSEEDTEKVFAILSFDALIDMGKIKGIAEMESFFDDNNISYIATVI